MLIFSRFTRTIQEKLGLTRSEAAIILFLSFGLVVGAGVRVFHLDSSSQSYDFSDSDAFFSAATSRLDSVLAYEEDSSAAPSGKTKAQHDLASGPVNINSAGQDELTSLPGIGTATALKIIAYRSSTGRFQKVEDLMNVKGIGKKKFEKIKPHIRVE